MDSDSRTSITARHRLLKPLYILILAIVFLSLGVYSARQNNLTALRLRDAVIETDKQNGDTEKALKKLREYMYSHMNTELASGPSAIRPPIQLKYRYERLVEAEKTRVTAVNAGIYTRAQQDCERRFPKGLSGSGRIPCIQEFVAANGVKEQPIPDSLYKFDFASPKWSLDIAGICLAVSAVLFVLFIARLTLDIWLARSLKE